MARKKTLPLAPQFGSHMPGDVKTKKTRKTKGKENKR